MDTMVTTNFQTLNNASKKALELVEKLYNLEYFDKTNYEKNIKDFQFVLVNEDDAKLFQGGQFAIYVSSMNSILVKESIVHMGYINEEYLTMLLLHELIHMASCDREKGKIGYNNPKIVPITYNEGLTQYLALKTMYPDKLEEAIKNNIFYPESVKTVKESIDALGEKTIFNGFFEADLKKAVYDGLNPKELDKWIDYIMTLDSSQEEKMSRSDISNIEKAVEEQKL